MRKIYLLFLMLFLVYNARAQVSFYSFSQSGGVYEEFTDGTVLATATGAGYSDSFDNVIWPITFPLGFDFKFNQITYTGCNVSSNGFLTFGTTSPSLSEYNPLSSSTAYAGAIAAWGKDLNGAFHSSITSNVSWKVTGTAPNRILVVQYKNIRPAPSTSTTDIAAINFQIRLFEGSHVVKIVYGPSSTIVGSLNSESSTQVGLRGANSSDYHYRTNTSAQQFIASTAGTVTPTSTNSQKYNVVGTVPGMPTSGLTYTYTPPVPCAGTPNGGVVSIARQNLCSGATPAAISVTNVNTGSTGISYKWQESTDNITWADVSGATTGITLSYTPPAYNGTTKYYRLKTTCANGEAVAYSTVSEVTGSATPLAVTSLAFSGVSDYAMTIGWTNGGGNRRMVVFSDTNNFTDPVDGEGPALTAAAAYSGSGQQIVFDGTGNSVTVTLLSCSKTYYIRVYEYVRCGSSAPYTYWYALPTSGSQVTNATSLSTLVENMPEAITLTGFSGTNLPTISPGWDERTGDGPFTANTSAWTNSSVGGVTTARINLYTTTRKEWIISPPVNLNVASRVVFKAAMTASTSTNPASNGGMVGTDDKIQVMISTDACGNIWTPLYTIDSSNASEFGTSLVPKEIVIPNNYIGQNVRIGFKATDGPLSTPSRDYYFHLADIVIEAIPPCSDVFGVAITNVTKNSATVSWPASNPVPSVGYEYEIRTTGTPGTPGAVQTGTVAFSVLTKNLTGLLPDTEYRVFVRSNCNSGLNGAWSEVVIFKTKCNYPDLVSTTPASRCGAGTVNLNATFASGTVKWFDSQTGGNAVGTGNTFTTPIINAPTSYWVESSIVGGISTAGRPVPLTNSVYNGTDTGLVFEALEAVEIQNVSVYSTSAGTINIQIVDSTGTQLYETGNVNITAGGITTPNIVPINYTVAPGTGYRMLIKAYNSVNLVRESAIGGFPYNGTDGLLNVTNGYISGTGTTYYYFYDIKYIGKCTSPRTEVVATVTPAPVLTLSTTSVEICEGQNSTVTVTAGASDYNTFVWSPAAGVTGNATTGWTFNPTESTVYTLTATQTSGSLCASIINVNVNVNPLPLMLDLGDELQACAGNVLQLKVGDNNVWPSNYFNSFETTALQGFVLGGTGVTAATTTLVSSVGSRSLNMVTVSSANGYVTLSNSLNLTDFTSPYLTFDHIAAMEGAGDNSYDFGYVEYSLDGGSTWILFKPADYVGGAQEIGSSATVGQRFSTRSYADWKLALTGSSSEPTNALWKTERFNLPTGADLSNVKIRFRATSDASTNYKGWFIDNVNIKEAPITTAIWSPVTNLYTDALATVPYVAGANAAMVYFKSDVAMAETDYTVTVVSQAGCTVSQTVAITNTFVATPVALAQSFCEEIEVTNIVVNGLTTGATLKWFETATSTTEITTISTTGTYYVVQVLNECFSARVAVDIAINSITVAPVTNQSQVFCGDFTVADLVATPLSGNTIGWFNSETSVVPMNLTDQLVSGVYYVSQYNGSCWSPRATVTVSVNPVPDAPASIAQNFCGTRPLSEVNLGQASNATLKWYETSTSVAVLPITTQLATGTYYVAQMINGCESSRVAIPVIIQDVLPAPVAPSSQLYCGTTLISDLAAASVSNGIIGWFSSLTSTTPIASTQNVSTGTYYVAQFNGACWSNKTVVNVTVNPKPAAPSNATIHLCGNYNFGQVSIGQVSGATIKWYATETSVTPINLGTNVVSGSYYVSQTVGGCESDRVMVNIFQTDALSNPTAVSQTFCGSATVADLVAQGTNGTIVWFNSSVALNPLSPNVALTTGTYYAAQTINGCISARVPISVFVVSVAAPNVDTFNFCGSATVADLVLPTPTGVVYKWFNSPSNPVQLDANTALVTGTYFVSRSQYGCESLRTPVIVNINSVPDAPTGVSPQVFIQGSTINDIVMNQPNVVWYMTQQDARNGVNPLVQGMPLVNGTTYYGVIIGTNGCPSLPFALTVDVYLSDDKFVKEELKYYPNPVEDILTVSYSDRILLIEVFDLLGKRVKVKSTDDKEVNIDLSDLASGTYMIQLKTENKAQFLKIIKK